MSYAEAVNILDLRRAGRDMPRDVVDKALELTGDIQGDIVREAMDGLIVERRMA